jgi:hypothetical protein
MRHIPEKVQIDFTDEKITGSAGGIFLGQVASRMGLPEMLARNLSVKVRDRGASDSEMMLSLIYSLAQGDGALCDVDRLGADESRQLLLGLGQVPGSRRLGEYLSRFGSKSVGCLRGVAQQAAGGVIGDVARHLQEQHGYVPVFVDGTAVEVEGREYEGAFSGYNEEEQYWLHSVFVGPLWVSQVLNPGGEDVAGGWRRQLEETAYLLKDMAIKVWVRVDNAYYRGEVVSFCRAMGWDYSISVTNDTYKKPLWEEVQVLADSDWEWLSDDRTEQAALICHQPAGWEEMESYVVVRSFFDGNQKLLLPRYSFILVSNHDMPLGEMVKRHRGKMGQENAQKGPLIDLDLHHPPCRSFHANQAFYTAGQIAQVLLVAVQYKLLPRKARIHGIRMVIRNLVRTAGRLVRHGRQWTLKFAKSALRLDWLIHAADRLDTSDFSPA